MNDDDNYRCVSVIIHDKHLFKVKCTLHGFMFNNKRIIHHNSQLLNINVIRN